MKIFKNDDSIDPGNNSPQQLNGIMKTLPVKQRPSDDSDSIEPILPGAHVLVSNIAIDDANNAWYYINFASETGEANGWVPANSVTLRVIAKTDVALETVSTIILEKHLAAKALAKTRLLAPQLDILKAALRETRPLTSINISAGAELLIYDMKIDDLGNTLCDIMIPSQNITAWVRIPSDTGVSLKRSGFVTEVFKAIAKVLK